MMTAERHLSVEDLADRLGLPVRTIYWMNQTGTAPPRMRIGRVVRYRLADVIAWEKSREVPDGR
jgi:predicted DNA-binding transcriptional regulator AlpA